MHRCVVVLALAGCFSKPPLASDDDPHDAAPDGDAVVDAAIDARVVTCTLTEIADLVTTTRKARGPWLSPDKMNLVLVLSDTSGTSIVELTRTDVNAPFTDATFNTLVSGTALHADPFLSDDQLTIWYATNAGHLATRTRSERDQPFSAASETSLAAVNGTASIVDGVWLSSDELVMLYAAGNGYPDEDLYRATRTSTQVDFGSIARLAAISEAGTNDCCPTALDGEHIVASRSFGGVHDLVVSAWDGEQPAMVLDVPGSLAYTEPHLTRDGSILAFVEVGFDSEETFKIRKADITCP